MVIDYGCHGFGFFVAHKSLSFCKPIRDKKGNKQDASDLCLRKAGELEDYLVSLAREYIDVIRCISSGNYSRSQLYGMESERATLHAQLEQAIGRRVRKDAMPAYAQRIINENQ